MPIPLSLELLLSAVQDWESARYRFQAATESHRRALQNRCLFPTWKQAHTLQETLRQLLQQRHSIEEAFPHTVVGINWSTLQLELLPEHIPAARERALHQFFAFVEWALPVMDALCQDSYALYAFATEHIAIHELGLRLPRSPEGFLLIPYRAHQQVLIWRYRVLPVVDAQQRPLVQLEPIGSLPLSPIWTPHLWQSVLRERFPEIQGALYLCESDEDFPLNETLLPIAEQLLAARVGEA